MPNGTLLLKAFGTAYKRIYMTISQLIEYLDQSNQLLEMIVDFIEHQGMILAVNDVGQLLIWNIAKHRLNNQCYQFQHNISIVPSQTVHTFNCKELTGIVAVGSLAAIYNKTHLYTLSLVNLVSHSQELQTTDLKGINLSAVLQTSEEISYLTALNSEAVVIATSKGNLLLYNLNEDAVVVKSSLWDQIKTTKDAGLLATTHEPIPQITSIVCFRSGNVGLVGLGNGKIFSVEMNELRALDELTSCLNNQLEKINRLYLNEKEDKVYSLHQNYIVEWNYKLHSCISYLEYCSPRGMAQQKNSFIVIGMHPTLTLIDRQAFGHSDEVTKQVQLSMRGALVIKELGGQLLAVGGTDNLVDIFINHSRLMTLIHK